jgi:type IX secretion system PorP/SprF family membrane protein
MEVLKRITGKMAIGGAMVLHLTLFPSHANAQYDPYFSHYFDMETTFNPAAAGRESKTNFYAAYAMTMAGFENAPKTMVFAGDTPFTALGSIHGAGAMIMSDKIGLFTHQCITGVYALRKRLSKEPRGSQLSIGIQPGMLTEKFRGSEVETGEDNDDAIPKSDVDGNAFDLGFGILFQRANWYAGISAQHLTFPKIKLGERNELKLDATYYLTGGINFQLRNPFIKIAASTLVMTEGITYRADITGRVMYTFEEKMLYAGINYSPTRSVTLLVGGVINGFKIGYSFEGYTNELGFRNGSHEIFLGYSMDVDLGKRGKNRHQTTRTL